ncbi:MULTISPECIES: Ldh family oxidoreductase [Halomonadaceae]|uniref:Lactate dehydrogenase n=1 Tax=Vreelandella hamiltonii TaxID=502829 RepID=A0A8H9I3G6_9GAMM|nr:MULTISPECIES: Ldh family oxidoreductase [Halomonas]GGW25928.1 lactate dehydrogenase [Halomonas hamiltonii]
MSNYYDVQHITQFSIDLLGAAGLDHEKAKAVADVLVEGDLMGHTTHGLQLLSPYLEEIHSGRMPVTGEYETISERTAVQTWDGRYLPGPWLILKAMDAAETMARTCGTGTVVIRRSNHIACLAAYLKRATDKNLLVIIESSDPATKSVAPYGGLQATHTPNPIAVGYPTDSGPVLLDVSTSITTNGMVGRLHKHNSQLPFPWLKDHQGNATNQPSVLFDAPKGSIMPIGGLDHGHKGYALGLMVEALTSGLAGFGRVQKPSQWGASVMVQIMDPGAFGGLDAFKRETGALVDACRNNPVAENSPPVRIPGERGLALHRRYMQEGVPLPNGVPEALIDWSKRLGVIFPNALE